MVYLFIYFFRDGLVWIAWWIGYFLLQKEPLQTQNTSHFIFRGFCGLAPDILWFDWGWSREPQLHVQFVLPEVSPWPLLLHRSVSGQRENRRQREGWASAVAPLLMSCRPKRVTCPRRTEVTQKHGYRTMGRSRGGSRWRQWTTDGTNWADFCLVGRQFPKRRTALVLS